MACDAQLAGGGKGRVTGPPLASLFAEAISVKNQCPPLDESNRHEGSPPLLHPRPVSPMRVSSGIGADKRCRRWLNTRTSPMLLVSATNPLPAHSPWSAGSMSPSGLVGSVPLSTAFSPFTPTEPPADMLMGSQPGPSGSQLAVVARAGGSAPPLTSPREAAGDSPICGGTGDGMT